MLVGFRHYRQLISRTMSSKHLEPGREQILRSKEYFMAAAILASKCSPDPRTQVGACLVKNSQIIGLGCNQFPDGCENKFSWARNGVKLLDSKHGYVIHAEPNAILTAPSEKWKDSELYVTLVPCHECAKLIVRCGIAAVYFLHDRSDETFMVSKNMLKTAEIPCIKYDGRTDPILIEY